MLDYLIIGKNGQLATELSKLFKTENINFKSLSRDEIDILDEKSSYKKIKKLNPKIIINTSAYHVLPLCEEFPAKAFEINTVAAGSLANISSEIGAKYVTLSTNYVFDGEKKSKYKEEDKVNPLQIYGLSKLAGEFNSFNKCSKTYVIRTCGLYGNGAVGSRDKRGNFILKVIDEARKTGVIKASKDEIVSPTYAVDLSIGILKLTKSNAKPGIYHLVNEGATNWHDLSKNIVNYMNLDAKVVAFNSKTSYKRPLNSALKNSKAKKLGVILPGIENGLFRYLDQLSKS